MHSIWMSHSELAELTGYKYKSRIAAWLKINKFEFILNATGLPLVGRSQIEMRLSGMQISTIKSANDGNKKTINFDKLDQITRKQA